MENYIWAREVGLHHPTLIKLLEHTRRSFAILYNQQISQPNKPEPVSIRTDHRGPILSLALESHEDRYLLSSSGDSGIRLYDGPLDECPRLRHSIDKPISHQFSCTGITWYPWDNGMFITSSMDKTIKIWDTLAMEEVIDFNIGSAVNSHAMSPCSQHHSLISAATSDPRVFLCDLRSGGIAQTLNGHKDSLLACKWSPRDDHILVTAGQDRSIKVWDIRRSLGNCLETISFRSTKGIAHDKAINSLKFNEEGSMLVSAGNDNRIRVWNMNDFECEMSMTSLSYQNRFTQNTQIALNNECFPNLILCPSDNGAICGFELGTGAMIGTLKAHYGKCNCVEFKSSMDICYSGANDSDLLMWVSDTNGIAADDELQVGDEERNSNNASVLHDPGDQWSEDED